MAVAGQDVLGPPAFVEMQELGGERGAAFILIQFLLQCPDMIHLGFMLVLVVRVAGVMRQAHQAFFKQKMRTCAFGQLVEDLTCRIFVVIFGDRNMQAVDQVNEVLVLFVNLLGPDAEVVGPEEEIVSAQLKILRVRFLAASA